MYAVRRVTERQLTTGHAVFRLSADADGTFTLTLRDAQGPALGFTATHALPLGFAGTLIGGPDGRPVEASVYRCRPVGDGTYEGMIRLRPGRPPPRRRVSRRGRRYRTRGGSMSSCRSPGSSRCSC